MGAMHVLQRWVGGISYLHQYRFFCFKRLPTDSDIPDSGLRPFIGDPERFLLA
jgi:hypothetical protein